MHLIYQSKIRYSFGYFKLSIYSKMNFKESLLTQTTKQSLAQVVSNTSNQSIKVFIEVANRIFSISTPLYSKTIQLLIRDSLQQFNDQYSLMLAIEPQEYVVYAARRNGNKCRDYPSLDKGQNILCTNLKFYCLMKKNDQVRYTTYPLSQIRMQVEKKVQKKVKNQSACFCIF